MKGDPLYVVAGRRAHEDESNVDDWGFPRKFYENRSWEFMERDAACVWAERKTAEGFSCIVTDVARGLKVYETKVGSLYTASPL